MRSISIVMTYYNRPDQLRVTLESIRVQKNSHNINPEIVIVDDASPCGQLAAILNCHQDLNIKAVRIRPEEKTWMNPSVPYNIGFRHATGDITMIQNPECCHYKNVLQYVLQRFEDDQYMVFNCRATSQRQQKKLSEVCQGSQLNPIQYWENMWNSCLSTPEDPDRWFHHMRLKPTFYHFCTAISTHRLKMMGGFDERFANGYCFDDNELVWRLRKLKFKFMNAGPEVPMVFHQWHSKEKSGYIPEWYVNEAWFKKITAGEVEMWRRPDEAHS